MRLLCPPSFITPFTVNELCSSTPLSFSLSSVAFLLFLSTKGPKLCGKIPPAPHPIFHFVSSPPLSLAPTPPVSCLTPSKSQQSALGKREEEKKKTVSKLCLIRMTVHLFRHLPHKTCTRTCTRLAHYLKPASTCCDHYFKTLPTE